MLCCVPSAFLSFGFLIIEKSNNIKKQLDESNIEIQEWTEMNELFTKTLRYKLLDTLIPNINKSIQFFINKLEQNYKVEFDQEFKAHIFVDSFSKEISYNNLLLLSYCQFSNDSYLSDKFKLEIFILFS